MADDRISYNEECPECREQGIVSHMGFNMKQNNYSCDGPQPHILLDWQGETAPVLDDATPAESNTLVESDVADSAIETAANPAGRMAEIMATRQEQTATVNDVVLPVENLPITATKVVPADVLVGAGKLARLPGGDIICGIRIPEQWASLVEAEAETRNPPISAVEYLQELIDQGMLEWFAAPAPSFDAPANMGVRKFEIGEKV